jgi:hypothetical protein
MPLAALFLTLTTLLVSSQAPEADSDRTAVRQAVLDYAEGYYDHAPERMQRAISPLLTKRALMARPGVTPFLTQMNAEMLIEATRGTAPRPAAADRKLVAEVLDVSGDIASARVFSAQFNDYIHLVKRDGRWTLVSVLWHPPLSSPAPPAGIVPAIEQAARDYASGDAPRVVAALSPVAAIRSLMPAPSGARILGDQNAESMAARLASGPMPKPAAAPAVTVLGTDGDIASVKVGDGPATTYLHVGLLGGKWVVVNTLTSLTPDATKRR